jgi:hypothetical protein
MGTPKEISNAYFCADPEGQWIEQVQEDMEHEDIAATQDADGEGWSEYYNSAGDEHGCSV